MATRPWTPADLPTPPTAWIYASGGAAHNAAGEVYAGAQPASEYLPAVITEEAGRAYLEGASGHAGYIVAPGTEGAFSSASGVSVFAVHRLPSGLPADKAAIVCAVTDSDGGDAFALRYGSETPGGGGGGGGGLAPTLRGGLIDYWDFYLGQLVGRNGNAVTLVAGKITSSGKLGYGLGELRTVQTCASVPDEPVSDGASWSVSFWLKKTLDNVTWTGVGDPHQAGFASIVVKPGTNQIVSDPVTSVHVIPTNGNDWAHVVVTQEAGGRRKIYLNGLLDSEGAANSERLRMARLWGSKSYESSFGLGTGTSDEIGLWNRALTPEEVALLYNDGEGLAYDSW